MELLQKVKAFLSLHDGEDELAEHRDEPAATAAASTVAPSSSVASPVAGAGIVAAPPAVRAGLFSGRQHRRPPDAEVRVFVPHEFSDVADVADALCARRIVIANLGAVERALQQRILDFISGVAFAVDGHTQRFADSLYLITPAGVQVNAPATSHGATKPEADAKTGYEAARIA